jgi:hypothetical protein
MHWWIGAIVALCLPLVPGAAITPRWALLAFGCVLFLMGLRHFKFTVGHLIFGLLIAWMTISLLWAPRYDSIYVLWHFQLLFLLFMITADIEDMAKVFKACAIAMGINSLVCILQMPPVSLKLFTQNQPPGGLFFNNNFGAEAAALVLIGVIGYRLWWYMLPVLPGYLLQHSRGSMVALVVAGAGWVYSRNRFYGIVMFGGLVAGLGVLLWSSWTDDSISQRIAIWLDTIRQLTWAGHGIGSYYLEFPAHTGWVDSLFVIVEHAHDDFLEVAYELGVVGFVLFAALLFGSILTPGVERYVVAGFMAEAFFEFPLYNPATAVLFVVCLGYAYHRQSSIRHLLVRGRVLLFQRHAKRFQTGGSLSCI